MYKFKLSVLILLLVTGCSCKSSHMEEMKVTEPTDEFKNCSELIYSIKEAEYMVKYANKRKKFPHLFMSYPNCLPIVQMDAVRNKIILKDRFDYLTALYEAKGCAIPKKEQVKSTKNTNLKVQEVNLLPIQ